MNSVLIVLPYSYEVYKYYLKNKFPSFPECSNPCTRMEVEAKFKTKSQTNHSQMSFIFPRKIPVTAEFYTSSPLSLGGTFRYFTKLSVWSLVAEIGGYMGMLVGVSVMDVEIFVMKLIYFLKSKYTSKT